jgi:integrase
VGVKVRQKIRGKGKPWWVFLSHNGKRKSKMIGDKKVAQKVASEIKERLSKGDFGLGDQSNGKRRIPLLKAYAEMWLAMPHDWKESTRSLYKSNFSKHVFPKLGKQPINEIRRKDFKALIDKLLVKDLAPSTVGVIKAGLSGVLGHALDSELIENNPLQGLKIEGKKKRALDVDPLTEEEAKRLLEQAKNFRGGDDYPPLLCGLRTGMRVGEIQALQWGDIDFNDRFIEVRRSWCHGRITTTKNRRRRRVDMTPHLAETLKVLHVVQKKRALKNGRAVSEWVFADEKGEMLRRETFRRALNKCFENAGMRRVTIHGLRHSYTTIRLLRGHNVGDVSYQLGHSSISITYDVYGHWIPGKFKNEVDELDLAHPSAPYMHPEREPAQNL